MMLAVDVSNSMLAQDFEPSRLERTKFAIDRLTQQLEHRELKQQQGERQTDQILVLLVEILEHGRRELFFLDLVDFLHDLV